jgi:uncharacterized membrane protein YecN with MAPEG domain
MFNLPWNKHVLPQLRQRTWYGRGLIETIQVTIAVHAEESKYWPISLWYVFVTASWRDHVYPKFLGSFSYKSG